MNTKIVLISNDVDFFDFIKSKLRLRKSDSIFCFDFESAKNNLELLKNSVFVINSETKQKETLQFLLYIKDYSSIVFSYNDDEDFKISCYKNNANHFITPFTSDDELNALLKSLFHNVTLLDYSDRYRKFLVEHEILKENRDVYLDYKLILNKELEFINDNSIPSVLVAIAPNEKEKFTLNSDTLEQILLANIRKNDLLLNFAPCKYFLLMHDINLINAKKIWDNITPLINGKIYAGFINLLGKKDSQAINEVLNNLHININSDQVFDQSVHNREINNFRQQKEEFNKWFSNIVSPTFYRIIQMYSIKLYQVNIEQEVKDGEAKLKVYNRHTTATLKITTPGISKINIDVSLVSQNNEQEKRISFDPIEFEAGILTDILEDFMNEFNKEINNEHTK